MRNGEEMTTWSIKFGYESHKNVKDLRTMVRTIIECVKDNTKQAHLNHADHDGQAPPLQHKGSLSLQKTSSTSPKKSASFPKK